MFRLIFWLLVVFLILSFFGVSFQSVISSPTGQANIAFLTNAAGNIWHWMMTYASELVSKVLAIMAVRAQ